MYSHCNSFALPIPQDPPPSEPRAPRTFTITINVNEDTLVLLALVALVVLVLR